MVSTRQMRTLRSTRGEDSSKLTTLLGDEAKVTDSCRDSKACGGSQCPVAPCHEDSFLHCDPPGSCF